MGLSLTKSEESLLGVIAEREKKFDETGDISYTNYTLQELATKLGKETKEVKGLLGSLKRKNCIIKMDANGKGNVYYLSSTAREHFGLELV